MTTIPRLRNILFLSIFTLLSSCGQTIDYDKEEEYIKIDYKADPDILSYKGVPYTGILVRYHDWGKGVLGVKATYRDGKAHGPYKKYHENGQLSEKGTYEKGEKDGLFEFYSENGELIKKEIWKKGKRE